MGCCRGLFGVRCVCFVCVYLREWRVCRLPGTVRGPRVLPRLEDRGQPPFLHQFEAGNVGRSREGSRISPPMPHRGLRGCTLTRPRSLTDCARSTWSGLVARFRPASFGTQCCQPDNFPVCMPDNMAVIHSCTSTRRFSLLFSPKNGPPHGLAVCATG